MITTNEKTFTLLDSVLQKYNVDFVTNHLSIHNGTIKRWLRERKVPSIYFNDLNAILGGGLVEPNISTERLNDQFYTKPDVAKYCYEKLLTKLEDLCIDRQTYKYIEPSMGEGSFYKLLPVSNRIGIDLLPSSIVGKDIIQSNYLHFIPEKDNKYIVIGNPPFGLRGNLALRFINHSNQFADVVAFILPPLFDSDGKGVPKKRVKGYELAHSEKLPLNSFQYPNGKEVEVATIFQIWTKVGLEYLPKKIDKTCKTFIKVYSLSDGGTPSSTRNKNMLDKCDVYLPSTCFKGMQAYTNFEALPNRRGYGIKILCRKNELQKILFKDIIWGEVAFLSTNSALNLRTSLIENAIIERGFVDEY